MRPSLTSTQTFRSSQLRFLFTIPARSISKPLEVISGASAADLLDLAPVSDFECLFEQFAQFFSRPEIASTEKNTILRICNVMLRKSSKYVDANLHAKIQLFLSNLYDIEDKSGRNKKSQVWKGFDVPISFESSGPIIIDPVAYKKLRGFLDNNWSYRTSGELLPIFQTLLQLLTSLRQAILKENSTALLSHPSLLEDPNALSMISSDPSFIRTLILQLRFYFQIKATKLKFKEEELSELNKDEKKLLASLEEMIAKLQKISGLEIQKRNIGEVFSEILTEEAFWINWKNENFPPLFEELAKAEQKSERFVDPPENWTKSIEDNASSVLSLLNLQKAKGTKSLLTENHDTVN